MYNGRCAVVEWYVATVGDRNNMYVNRLAQWTRQCQCREPRLHQNSSANEGGRRRLRMSPGKMTLDTKG